MYKCSWKLIDKIKLKLNASVFINGTNCISDINKYISLGEIYYGRKEFRTNFRQKI